MDFRDIARKMEEAGFHEAGKDPTKERERLRKTLDYLCAAEGLGAQEDYAKKRTLVQKRKVPSQGLSSARTGVDQFSAGLRPKGSVRSGYGASSVDEGPVYQWRVDWDCARQMLQASMRSQLIKDQFGILGLRIFNLLSEREPKQKLEEEQIFEICMIPAVEGRKILNAMVRGFVLNWQEVPKSATAPLMKSFWLYYVDHSRVEQMMVQSALQGILHLRTRFRVESGKVAPLESRVRVGGLSQRERDKLDGHRRREDQLERSYLALAAVLLVFQCF